MKAGVLSACTVLIGVTFVSARPSTSQPNAQDGKPCGDSSASGIWRMKGDCKRGLEDWITTGGNNNQFDCCYSIPCSGTDKSGASFQGYCMSVNSDGNFNAPSGYAFQKDEKCSVWNHKGQPPTNTGNGDVSANPSQTPGRCVAPTARNSDASGVEGTGYNSVITDEQASLPPSEETQSDEPNYAETQEPQQPIPENPNGKLTAQLPPTDRIDFSDETTIPDFQ